MQTIVVTPRLAVATAVTLVAVLVGTSPADARRRPRRARGAPVPAKPAPPPEPAEPIGLVAATVAAKLRAEPGESTALVATVPVGTRLEVLGHDGRWLRVRHGKTRGWVTRTSVAGRAAEVDESTTAPRWRDRFGSAREMDTVRYPAQPPAPAPAAVDSAARAPSWQPSETRVRAGLGGASRAQSMSGADPAAGYRLRGTALTAGVGVDARFGRRAVVIADGSYGFGWGAGAEVRDADGAAMATVPFTTHEVDVGVAGGARLGAALVAARVGYHYEAALVDSLDNAARLPSEHLQGLMIGARGELALGPVGVRAGVDLVVAGERAQSIGLQDGMTSDASALFAQAGAGYTVRGLRIEGGYRFGRQHTAWEGPSSRQPGSSGASRTDRSHAITLGVSRRF